jgi:multiple antibiotic resistance protein
MDEQFIKIFTLLFVLLNPFLMSIYLLDLIRNLTMSQFFHVLVRAALISAAVFIIFSVGGERIFSDVLQVRFAAFLIFGGIIFIVIALRFVFQGSDAIHQMRGPAEYVAGAVAMPFIIGPGTISASVLAGATLSFVEAAVAIVSALAAAVVALLGIKFLHDYVKQRNVKLIDSYVDIVGRISALLIGAIAIEMVLQGLDAWLLPMLHTKAV